MKKTILALILIIFTLSLSLVGCGEKEKTYTVTYMLDNETVYKTYTDTSIKNIPIPAKKGFNFVNWYTKPDFSSNPIVLNMKLINDITVYAKFNEGIFEYTINPDNTSCTITNLYHCPLDKDVIFPSQINGYTVTNINIPLLNDVGYIESISFSDELVNNENFNISNLHISIENIKKINLSNLKNLNNIEILGCYKLETLLLPNVQNIPTNFFRFNTIDNIAIPNTITSICKNAFYGSNINNIYFEKNSKITTISRLAFNNIFNIKSINIPCSVTTIENDAFNDCSQLEKIILDSDNFLTLGSNNGLITNNKNTVIYVKDVQLEKYIKTYPKLNFEKIL